MAYLIYSLTFIPAQLFSYVLKFETNYIFLPQSTPCKHPVIVLQDVAFTDLHALVEFIYHGEVNVHQRSLSSFLKTAEVLRVSGLTQNDDAQGVSLAYSLLALIVPRHIKAG